uniref:FAT domain-containing protein n=1 Tax=Macrostomum lignano TaxID=282301 RepID=A0A1I8JMZ2_9PLAT
MDRIGGHSHGEVELPMREHGPRADKVAAMAIKCCWSNRSWDKLCSFLKFLPKDSYDANFFNAVYAIHLGVFDEARCFLDRSRDILDADIANAASDSYMRSYSICVSAQTLTELEEVMEYRLETDRRPLIRECWSKRLESCDKQVEDWWRLLQPLSKNSRTSFSLRVIASLMGFNPAAPGAKPLAPAMAEVSLAYAKHLWFSGQKAEATNRLTQLIRQLVAHQDSAGQSGGSMTANSPPTVANAASGQLVFGDSSARRCPWWRRGRQAAVSNSRRLTATMIRSSPACAPEQWRGGLVQPSSPIVADSPYLYCMHRCLGLVSAATDRDAELRKAWARFGLMSYESFMLARIDSPRQWSMLRLSNILVEVGKAHPQAMINPLILAFKSGGTQRRRCWNCNKILYNMESHSARLVSEGFMLNEELIRLAITWAEMWYESIEEASRAFFGETKDIRFCKPLHELMTKPPETLQETAFHQEYARELQECLELCAKYQRCRHMQELNVAWDIYYNIFRRLGKQVPAVQTLELSYSAPRLANYGTDWELAVPGTYLPRKPVIRVAGIKPTLKLINSKQKPRILTVNGSDGHGYTFLLKRSRRYSTGRESYATVRSD